MHEPVTANGLHQFKVSFHISLVASIVVGLIWWEHADYSEFYTFYWSQFLNGHLTFAYPIGFLISFSWLYGINYILPKLVFLAFHSITSYQVFRLLAKRELFGKREILACLYCLLNPILCLNTVYTGLFDTVIEFLVLNFVLVLESKKANNFIKDAIALVLIGLIISIKFVGLVIVIPYLISEKKTMLRRLFLVGCGMILVLVALFLVHISILDIVQPFILHAERTMYTIFDGLGAYIDGIETPLFVAWFANAYSRIAVPLTAVAVIILDIFCYKRNVSFRARVLLNILIFLTLFQVSNLQFYIWYLPMFVLVYNEFTPTRRTLQRKMAYQQGLFVLLSFLNPFAQFLNVFFIHDIIKNEIAMAKGTQLDPGPADERSRATEQPTPRSPTLAS